jgi:hypothetical protein
LPFDDALDPAVSSRRHASATSSNNAQAARLAPITVDFRRTYQIMI